MIEAARIAASPSSLSVRHAWWQAAQAMSDTNSGARRAVQKVTK